MARGERARERLKKYYRTAAVAEASALQEAFTGESDRAAIILVGSWLHDFLRELIVGHMPGIGPELKTKLFGVDRPLSSFGSQIDLACAMGLVLPAERDMLHVIREMRNAAAHARVEITFNTPEIIDLTKVLAAYEAEVSGDDLGKALRLSGDAKELLNRAGGAKLPRDMFIVLSMMLALRMALVFADEDVKAAINLISAAARKRAGQISLPSPQRQK
ncbi:MAG: hypothetical protein ABL957_14165 [Parvularculaceae bacterium]